MLPDARSEQLDATWDFIMMRPGKEPMEGQWRVLLREVGLTVKKIWGRDGDNRIIEVVLVQYFLAVPGILRIITT